MGNILQKCKDQEFECSVLFQSCLWETCRESNQVPLSDYMRNLKSFYLNLSKHWMPFMKIYIWRDCPIPHFWEFEYQLKINSFNHIGHNVFDKLMIRDKKIKIFDWSSYIPVVKNGKDHHWNKVYDDLYFCLIAHQNL